MPELPEVETISRQLNKLVIGKKIKSVEIRLPKIVKAPLAIFRQALVGAAIDKISRRAKILIIGLDNGWSLLVHLKMTGQLIYQGSGAGKYTHAIFNFTDGTKLFFNDLRQFGYLKPIKTKDLGRFFVQAGFGPEPMAGDFSLDLFRALLVKKPKARIKQFLMDPKNIAGIGNIYSDEILFASRVHPLRQASSLESAEIKGLFNSIKKILSQAIKLKGTSSSDYRDARGQKGDFAAKLKAYGREGKKCVKCKSSITRIKIGGRSAHFCPACQCL